MVRKLLGTCADKSRPGQKLGLTEQAGAIEGGSVGGDPGRYYRNQAWPTTT